MSCYYARLIALALLCMLTGISVSSQSNQISLANTHVQSPTPASEDERLPLSAPTQKSTNPLNCGLTPSRKVDEFGNLNAGDEMGRLDKFASILKGEHEDTRGFIIGYGGRRGKISEAQKRADRAKEYLVNKDPYAYNSKINTVDCGYRVEPATELWITPMGAAPPPCLGTISPSEARIKGAGKRRSVPRPAAN